VSLIGDALKRQQESQEGKIAPPISEYQNKSTEPSNHPGLTLRSKARSSQADELANAPIPTQKTVKHRPVMELILLGIGLALVVFGAFSL